MNQLLSDQHLIFNRSNFLAGFVGACAMIFSVMFIFLSQNFFWSFFLLGFLGFGVLAFPTRNNKQIFAMAVFGGFGAAFSGIYIFYHFREVSIFYMPPMAAAFAAIALWDWQKWLVFSFMAAAITFVDYFFIWVFSLVIQNFLFLQPFGSLNFFILGFIFCFCMNIVMNVFYKKVPVDGEENIL